MKNSARWLSIALPLSSALLFVACGRGGEGDAQGASSGRVNAKAPIVARVHAHTPELDRLRHAIEFGDAAQAAIDLDAARAAGEEEPLLRARLLALEPQGLMDALRRIEAARTATPKNPDVYATAAEIYAGHGSFDTAWNEIQRGETNAGEAAELFRARGVIWISRENGASKGLEFLERARALDPDLPFTDRALAQAHVLVAKLEQQKKNQKLALAHVTQALVFDPTDVDARRLMSELQAARGDFAAAIALIQGLVHDGQKLDGELASLHKKAGIAALLEGDRPRAVEHFRGARELGLEDAELGSGARILGEECAARIERGVEAYTKSDLEGAERSFRSALALEPSSLAGRNHLAVVLRQERQYAEASTLWRGVIADARAERIELPEPVHINLAGALVSSGDVAGARAVLDDYLEREPQGEWRAETSRALANLPAAK